ncbi:RHS repeat domain-containing protein [Roseimarinus sediminis]|uniref:RHS repeat domain-containing protein n=1 Tax=Roseimarinus sediminis TaxID=1610899 RepID=UPI003D1C5298
MVRNYDGVTVDYLWFTYNTKSNQIKSISDGGINEPDFDDYLRRSVSDYSYDSNGNMRFDPGKNATIYYNHLNLPQIVNLPYYNKIFYHYDASGNKLAQHIDSDNSDNMITRQYTANAMYTDGDVSFLYSDEGRVVPHEIQGVTQWQYQYFLKDLPITIGMGNTRVTFSVDHYTKNAYVTQTCQYYPFGMAFNKNDYYPGIDNYNVNRNLYNGKLKRSGNPDPSGELQDDNLDGVSLNWYDYGARMYDAALGRFHTVDAYAEKYLNLSPYQYGANNPICNVDINGDSIWFTTQYDDNHELIGVTMNITGKVINTSEKNVNMEVFANTVNAQMAESYSGEFDGVKFSTVSNFEVAESTEDISSSDHVIAVADFDDVGRSESSDGSSIDYKGYSPVSYGKLSFVDSDHFLFGIPAPTFSAARTATHEMGHNLMGSGHVDGSSNMSWWNRYSNLMNQGGNGVSVTSGQLGSIYNNRKILNQGTTINYGRIFNPRVKILNIPYPKGRK